MSFLDDFKISMMVIVEEMKRGNAEYADSLLDPLFDKLDEELETRVDLKSIHASIHDINTHLSVISNGFKLEAGSLYKELQEKELREALEGFYARYLQSFSNSSYPLACKCVFQQIESLVSFLWVKRNLLNEVTKDSALREKYEKAGKTQIKPNENGYYFISLYLKLRIISDFYKKEFKSIESGHGTLDNFTYSTKNYYNKCYNLRHHDSHGFSFGGDVAAQSEVDEFGKNAATYLQAPITLIQHLLQLVIITQNQ